MKKMFRSLRNRLVWSLGGVMPGDFEPYCNELEKLVKENDLAIVLNRGEEFTGKTDKIIFMAGDRTAILGCEITSPSGQVFCVHVKPRVDHIRIIGNYFMADTPVEPVKISTGE